jgi:hypothetical protein
VHRDNSIYFLTLKHIPGQFIAGDFIAIAGEMRRFPASNENNYHFSYDRQWQAYIYLPFQSS